MTRLVLPTDPVLRKPTETVSLAEGGRIARRLVSTLDGLNRHATRANKKGAAKPHGIGLAAPQIGLAKSVCVFWTGRFFQPLINPRLLAWIGHFRHQEGCLSFPGLSLEVSRYTGVVVAADNLGSPLQVGHFGVSVEDALLKDLMLAACVQHEVAHCFGLTLHDFVEEYPPTPDEWEQYAKSRPVELEAKP